MSRGQIRIGVKGEAAINREFVEAWKQAERGALKEPEVHLYFLNVATLQRVLSDRRVALLKVLRQIGPSSIRNLAMQVQRDYRNVYDDLQLLLKAGLVEKDARNRVMVPWDKIQTEIDLAA
ncbi:MAG: transcriptional regulator [candidate division NC10 bacterium]|nr:transcriptional regulator [candidate division NC10 bacterium]